MTPEAPTASNLRFGSANANGEWREVGVEVIKWRRKERIRERKKKNIIRKKKNEKKRKQKKKENKKKEKKKKMMIKKKD